MNIFSSLESVLYRIGVSDETTILRTRTHSEIYEPFSFVFLCSILKIDGVTMLHRLKFWAAFSKQVHFRYCINLLRNNKGLLQIIMKQKK